MWSVLYYFVVCWSEVIGALVPGLACTFLSGQVNQDDDWDDDDEDEDISMFEMNQNATAVKEEEGPQNWLMSFEDQLRLQIDMQKVMDKKLELQKQIKSCEAALERDPASLQEKKKIKKLVSTGLTSATDVANLGEATGLRKQATLTEPGEATEMRVTERASKRPDRRRSRRSVAF